MHGGLVVEWSEMCFWCFFSFKLDFVCGVFPFFFDEFFNFVCFVVFFWMVGCYGVVFSLKNVNQMIIQIE